MASCLISLVGCTNHSLKAKPSASAAAPSPEPAPALRAQYRFSAADSTPSATSSISFKVAGGSSKREGSITSFSGTIQVSDASPEQSAVTVDMDMTALMTGDPKLTAFLESRAFLNVAQFPSARFVSTSIAKGGELGATDTVTGNLELHGRTKPIAVPATIHIRPDGVDVDAEFILHRRDFGLTLPGKLDDSVGDEIVLMLLVTGARVPEH